MITAERLTRQALIRAGAFARVHRINACRNHVNVICRKRYRPPQRKEADGRRQGREIANDFAICEIAFGRLIRM